MTDLGPILPWPVQKMDTRETLGPKTSVLTLFSPVQPFAGPARPHLAPLPPWQDRPKADSPPRPPGRPVLPPNGPQTPAAGPAPACLLRQGSWRDRREPIESPTTRGRSTSGGRCPPPAKKGAGRPSAAPRIAWATLEPAAAWRGTRFPPPSPIALPSTRRYPSSGLRTPNPGFCITCV